MKRAFIVFIFILIPITIITSVSYWFYNNFEYISEEVESGFRGEARKNPLLAAEQLLKRMGTPVKQIHTLPNHQLDSQSTLILLEYGSFIKPTQTKQLLKWVRKGGHLIWVSRIVDNVQEQTIPPNPLFELFDIQQHQNHLKKFAIAQTLPTKFIWNQQHLEVAFDSKYFLKASSALRKIGNKYGTHLLFYYFDAGMISVLSDMRFIENDKIGQFDHAQFLWLLANFERPATKVWLLATQDMLPSLWALLWANMWAIIISTTVLLLFWLWVASRRFGSLLPVPPRARRRLLEHVEASGYFWWQQDQSHVLLHTAKQALLKRLGSVYPDWISLEYTELSQRLAQISGLNASEIENALNNNKTDSEVAFTQTIQIFTQIRKML